MAPPLAQELRTKEAEAMCEVDPIIRPPCRDYPFPIPISMSDQTTNDEQAGYAAEPKGLIPSPNLPGVSYNAEGIPVNKDGKPINIMDEPKRGPMLSDAAASLLLDQKVEDDPTGQSWLGLEIARDFYEAKIASGELMAMNAICSDKWCGTRIAKGLTFCPGCGAQIVEA